MRGGNAGVLLKKPKLFGDACGRTHELKAGVLKILLDLQGYDRFVLDNKHAKASLGRFLLLRHFLLRHRTGGGSLFDNAARALKTPGQARAGIVEFDFGVETSFRQTADPRRTETAG